MNRECLILFFSIYLFVASSSLRLNKNELDFLKQKFVERNVSPKLDDEVDVDLWNRLNEQEIANSPSIDDFSNEENALRWLKWYFRIAERFYQVCRRKRKFSLKNLFFSLFQVSAVLSWRYETNITVENEKLKSKQALRRSPFISQVVPIAQRFSEELKNSNNQRVRRIFNHLARTTINDDATLQSVSQLSSQMTAIYSTSKVCSNEKCFSLSPDLESFMQNEKDYDRLLWAWKSWHDQCGNQIRPIYLDYIDLINENLKKNGKINLAVRKENLCEKKTKTSECFFFKLQEHWIAEYEMGNAREFEGTTDRLLDEIMPLYRELHGYVRGRLCEIYPKRFDCTGPIPAHLLGNMWAQAWQNRFDDFIAYPDAPLINMTEIFENKSISIHEMYRMAENLFTSIGLYPMTKKFWSRSLFRKPTDRDVVCHAAASDFDYRDDYRVRICTERNEEHFYTIHHEMGHIQYYMSYDESQPFVYRNGANSGFHEAIGDTIGMFARELRENDLNFDRIISFFLFFSFADVSQEAFVFETSTINR